MLDIHVDIPCILVKAGNFIIPSRNKWRIQKLTPSQDTNVLLPIHQKDIRIQWFEQFFLDPLQDHVLRSQMSVDIRDR